MRAVRLSEIEFLCNCRGEFEPQILNGDDIITNVRTFRQGGIAKAKFWGKCLMK